MQVLTTAEVQSISGGSSVSMQIVMDVPVLMALEGIQTILTAHNVQFTIDLEALKAAMATAEVPAENLVMPVAFLHPLH